MEQRVITRALAPALIAAALACGVAACQPEEPFPSSSELTQLQSLRAVHTPPPSPTNRLADDEGARALGALLFDEKRLSGCETVSCSSCHVPPTLAAKTALTPGCGGLTTHNVPSLLNAGARDWLTWDGRKDSIWAQTVMPLENPLEMASSPDKLRSVLETSYAPQYQALFGKTPGDEADFNLLLANFGKVMEAFLRTQVKIDSPFDTALASFLDAANRDIATGSNTHAPAHPSYLGFKTFVRAGGCVNCHAGPFLSDGHFHNVGLDQHGAVEDGHPAAILALEADPLNGAGEYSDDAAQGALKVASARADDPPEGGEGAWSTASLRNVGLTAPYMRTGTLATLDDVVDFYNRGGDDAGTFRGKKAATVHPLKLTRDEHRALVDLLNALSAP